MQIILRLELGPVILDKRRIWLMQTKSQVPRLSLAILMLLVGFSQVGCVRDLINKYQSPSTSRSAAAGRDKASSQQAATPQRRSSRQQARPQVVNKDQPSIYAVDKNRFRFRIPIEQVWDSTLDVLLQNYNLTIVDRRSGIITTEWDSFYLDDSIYRNKVSIRMKKLSWDLVDVTIYNNVEVFKPSGPGGISSTWLPTERGPQEVGRILQNLAISLRQPAPILPNEMVAGRNLEDEPVRAR